MRQLCGLWLPNDLTLGKSDTARINYIIDRPCALVNLVVPTHRKADSREKGLKRGRKEAPNNDRLGDAYVSAANCSAKARRRCRKSVGEPSSASDRAPSRTPGNRAS